MQQPLSCPFCVDGTSRQTEPVWSKLWGSRNPSIIAWVHEGFRQTAIWLGWDEPDSKTKISTPTLTKPPGPINRISTRMGMSAAHVRSADTGGPQAFEGRAYVK